MSVYERVMALGDWDIQTHGMPQSVRDAIIPYSHIVVMPGRVSLGRLSDAATLDASLYTGVVLQTPGTEGKISGHGVGYWLGDSDDKGPILESLVTFGAVSLATWITALQPSTVAAGTVVSPGGTLPGTYQWVTPRAALDGICAGFGVEWRVNNQIQLDVGTPATLYGSTPKAIAARGAGPDSPTIGLQGLESDIVVSHDFYDYASRVIVSGPGGRAASGGQTPYRDGFGNLFYWTKVADSGDTPPGGEGATAANLVASTAAVIWEVDVTAHLYAITRTVPCGSTIYIYDPEYGLRDSANIVRYQGRQIYPTIRRVLGVRWPLELGMTVMCRYWNGASFSYVDLTDYVEFESPGAKLEVV